MLNPQLNFLISAIHRGCCMSTKDILSWMKKKNNEICYHLQQRHHRRTGCAREKLFPAPWKRRRSHDGSNVRCRVGFGV